MALTSIILVGLIGISRVYLGVHYLEDVLLGGGIGIVCGYGREDLPSVLGDRSCVGMVGGTIYVRGPVAGLSDEVWLLGLDDADKSFLKHIIQWHNISMLSDRIQKLMNIQL